MAATSVYVSRGSCSWPRLLQETLQDQQVGLTQSPITAFALDPRACEWSLYFPPALWDSQLYALLVFKAKCSGGSFSWHITHRLWSPPWGSDPSLLGENLCNGNIPLVCGLPTQGMRLAYITIPPVSFGSFFISLVVEGLFWWVVIFVIRSVSVNISNFCVFMKGSDLRLLLLHHHGNSLSLDFFNIFLKIKVLYIILIVLSLCYLKCSMKTKYLMIPEPES